MAIFVLEQAVDQRRFADVGATDDRDHAGAVICGERVVKDGVEIAHAGAPAVGLFMRDDRVSLRADLRGARRDARYTGALIDVVEVLEGLDDGQPAADA